MPFVFAAELRRAFVSHRIRGVRDCLVVRNHKAARLAQSQIFWDCPPAEKKGKTSKRDAATPARQRGSKNTPAKKTPSKRVRKSARYTAMSRFGEIPKCLLYSRLNCVGLSYPTAYAAFATVSLSEIIRRRASCNRRFFWY